MGKGYVVALFDVDEKAEPTRQHARALRRSSTPVILSDSAEEVAGEWPDRVAVVEFDSLDEARAWYQDPAKRVALGSQLADGSAMIAIIEGVGGSDDDRRPPSRAVRDYDLIRGAEFYDTPAISQDTGATVGDIVITGTPPKACGLTPAPVAVSDQPGDQSGWFAGADQGMPVPQVVLDLSEPVRSFGTSFLHYDAAGVDATQPARLRVYDEPGGQGRMLGEAVSTGGEGVLDFVALVVRQPRIRSATIDSPNDRTYCVTGYSILP